MTSPLEAVSWPIRTERLVLRRLKDGDLGQILVYRSQPRVAEWIGSAAADIASLTERFGGGETAVVVEHDGQLIGDVMVRLGDAYAQHEVVGGAVASQAELGWTFDPAHQGRGFATETVQALFGICFDNLGLRRVVAACFAANEPSWRLMERVRMRREAHHIEDSLHREHGWQDEYVYALLASEWRASR